MRVRRGLVASVVLAVALPLGAPLSAWPTPARQAARPATVKVVFAGDVLMGGSVGRRIEQRGAAFPFRDCAKLLRSADIAFANLEGPFTTRSFALSKQYRFRADPRWAPALAAAGLDVVSLANNHMMDCGPDGLGDTMDALKAARVQWCGAARGPGDPTAPTVLTVRGLRIAFVGITQHGPVGDAQSTDPRLTRASVKDIARCVARARKLADIVILSIHWGIEVTDGPCAAQVQYARAALGAGADLVVGHHPHVLQGFLLRRPRKPGERTALVAYSLGNFVFGYSGPLQSQTVVLRCEFDRTGLVGADVVPMEIVDARPRPATAREARPIVHRLKTLSARLRTAMTGTRILARP